MSKGKVRVPTKQATACFPVEKNRLQPVITEDVKDLLEDPTPLEQAQDYAAEQTGHQTGHQSDQDE